MTPEEHNKYLAYSHFGYAGFQLFMSLVMAFFFYLMMEMTANDPHGGPPPAFFAIVLVFMLFFQLLFTVPSVIAGFGLLKRRHWAKTASIVAGVMSAMSFPIGTAVCVYTFWFLFGAGKDFYTRPQVETGNEPFSFLNEPSSANEAGAGWPKREREYVPPREMPNWRD